LRGVNDLRGGNFLKEVPSPRPSFKNLQKGIWGGGTPEELFEKSPSGLPKNFKNDSL
jgi:hypothetical protein